MYSLFQTLINRKLISINTEVKLFNDSNHYLIKKIIQDDNNISLKIMNINTHLVKVVLTEDIHLIDGMDPVGLADAYDIMPNGSKKVLGKRRGRPRKHFRPEIE